MNIKKLFLENIGIKQTIFKNTFWLILAEIVTSLLRFFLIIYAARAMGAMGYGEFSFALSFVSLFTIFSDLGTSTLIIREFSITRENEKKYPAIISLKLFLGMLVMLVTIIGSFFITQSMVVRGAIWILVVFIFIDSLFALVYSFIRARQKMEYEALAKTAQAILTAIFGFFVIYIFPSPIYFSFAYLLASIGVLILVAVYFHSYVYMLKLEFDVALWKNLLKNSWPLTFGFIGIWLCVNIDSVVIGFFGTTSEVGWFNAANRVVFAIIILFAGLISRSYYPSLSKFFSESRENFQKVWDSYLQIMIWLAFPLMVGGVVFSSKIIEVIYGIEKYSPSIISFQILILASGISLLCYPFSMMLVISGQQKKNFFIILSGVIINTVLSIIFVPRYGFNAASISTLASCVIIFVLSFLFLKHTAIMKPFTVKMLLFFAISCICSMIMFLVINQPIIYGLNVFASILIGCAVYLVSFFTIQKVSVNII